MQSPGCMSTARFCMSDSKSRPGVPGQIENQYTYMISRKAALAARTCAESNPSASREIGIAQGRPLAKRHNTPGHSSLATALQTRGAHDSCHLETCFACMNAIEISDDKQ